MSTIVLCKGIKDLDHLPPVVVVRWVSFDDLSRRLGILREEWRAIADTQGVTLENLPVPVGWLLDDFTRIIEMQ